ncbi:DUF262 domain-containing protein [Veillonella criceti]|uniref:Uncharacterized conserved protein n=1 Tax=Veillonella criceti TaxID=103891 RepID=A0A380NLQ5_9FIRM|nr:DUF262 domain-containing protein [Veillonella criceti]SUP44190.1 Uncharacterized conserved protein [Veillonella criceti]
MAEITSTMKTLKEILYNEDIFTIPDFQRSFVWGANEVNVLFNDFDEDTNGFKCNKKDLNNLPGYLLGNIVLVQDEENKKQYEVIDGQQRLTTLTLLFCALYYKFSELRETENDVKWGKHAAQLCDYYSILDGEFQFESVKVLHNDSLEFKNTYQDIIKSGEFNNTDNQSSNNIIEVYEAIEDNLNKIANEDIELLVTFKSYLTEKVKLIVTTAPSIERAFQLFEVLNDRGQTLEPMDLLKNHFLKELSNNLSINQINEFVVNWNTFLKNLKVGKKVITASTFMKHFILSDRGDNIKKNSLLSYFKEIYLDPIKEADRPNYILKLSAKLKEMSRIYSSIEKNSLENDYLKNNKSLFCIFKLLSVTQMHPILMNFYHSDEKIKSEAANICVQYGAAVIFSFTQTNHIEKELPSIIRKLKDSSNDNDKIKILKEEIRKKIKPYIEDLNQLLPTKDLAGANKHQSSKALQLLKFIELYFCENDNIMSVAGSKIQLEHIMPYDSDYKEYNYDTEENRINFLNRIGNLTLLMKNANSSASNKKFEEKSAYYEASEFKITSTLVKEAQTPVAKGQHRTLIDNINNYLFMKDTKQIKLWSAEEINQRGLQITKLMDNLLTGQI